MNLGFHKSLRNPTVRYSPSQHSGNERLIGMLYTIAVVLLVLWLVGWLGFHLLGGLIHILIVLAVISFLAAIFKKAP